MMDKAIKDFGGGAMTAAVLLAWFAFPLDVVMRFCNGTFAFFEGKEADSGRCILADDLIPVLPGVVISSAVLLAAVVILFGIYCRRPRARIGGVLLMIAALPAGIGDFLNLALLPGAWMWLMAALAVGSLMFAVVKGVRAGVSSDGRRWFAGATEDGSPDSPVKAGIVFPVVDRLSITFALLAAGLALFCGLKGLGVDRAVVVHTRESLTGGGLVLAVDSLSEEPRVCRLELDGLFCGRFGLKPKGCAEFGLLEVGRSLQDGDSGTLSVKGRPGAVRFTVRTRSTGGYYSSVDRHAVLSRGFANRPSISFGQKPSVIGGYVVEVKNTDGLETISGTFELDRAEKSASAPFRLAPGEAKTFGRVELFTAIRAGEKVCVKADGYAEPCAYVVKE